MTVPERVRFWLSKRWTVLRMRELGLPFPILKADNDSFGRQCRQIEFDYLVRHPPFVPDARGGVCILCQTLFEYHDPGTFELSPEFAKHGMAVRLHRIICPGCNAESVIEEALPGKEWMIDECKFPREKEGVL